MLKVNVSKRADLLWLIFTMVIFTNCTQPSFTDGSSGNYDGQKIYEYYCTSCHGPNGDRGAGRAANLVESKMEDDAIRQIILFGAPNGMAAYQSLIKEEEELNALVDYVKTLRK